MGLFKEFREFALKGNVVDLAVGIIIGAAFGKIVSSLVNDVVMPPIGSLLGGVDFSDFAITLQEARKTADGKDIPAVVLKYGTFINTVIDFTIVAFAVFMLVKVFNTAKKRLESAPPPAAAPAAPPAPTRDQQLLAEIRDLLKQSPAR